MPLIPTTAIVLLKRNALRKGVMGNSGGWKAIAVVVFGGRFLKKILVKEPEVVSVEKLRPGQTVTITSIERDTRRNRRRARRAQA